MSTNPRDTTTADKKSLITNADTGSLSRAQENDYEFALAGEEHVNVKNTSYDETGHVYTVAAEDGLPASCTCPAFEHHDGPCKHQLACVIRAPVMEALAASSKSVVADGGVEPAEPTTGGETSTTPYTTHLEPGDQGGGRYARCTGCEREIIPVGRFDKLDHAAGCPVGEEGH